jgi:hypothetical protein
VIVRSTGVVAFATETSKQRQIVITDTVVSRFFIS